MLWYLILPVNSQILVFAQIVIVSIFLARLTGGWRWIARFHRLGWLKIVTNQRLNINHLHRKNIFSVTFYSRLVTFWLSQVRLKKVCFGFVQIWNSPLRKWNKLSWATRTWLQKIFFQNSQTQLEDKPN